MTDPVDPWAPIRPTPTALEAAASVPRSRAWDELTGALIWPGLLRAGALALRPARLGLAFLLIMVLAIFIALADTWLHRSGGSDVRGLGTILRDQITVVVGRVNGGHLGLGLLALLSAPVRMLREHPGVTMLLALPVAVAGAVFGGTISRTAATEFARHERSSWMETLRHSLRRWWTQALALLLPLVLLAVVASLLALAGKVMLGFQATSLLGGALFGFGALVGLLFTLAVAVFVLALPMLIPAVLAEGTDSIDSIQRSAAYVVAQPVRYVVYVVILVLQAVLITALLVALVRGAFVVTGTLAAMFLPEPFDALVRQSAMFGTLPTLGLDAAEFPRWQARTGELIVFWRRLLTFTIPASYAVSFFYSAGAVLYLSMRRLCDGQDPGELWHPGSDDAAPRAFAGDGEEEL